jgi:hypothetical protein
VFCTIDFNKAKNSRWVQSTRPPSKYFYRSFRRRKFNPHKIYDVWLTVTQNFWNFCRKFKYINALFSVFTTYLKKSKVRLNAKKTALEQKKQESLKIKLFQVCAIDLQDWCTRFYAKRSVCSMLPPEFKINSIFLFKQCFGEILTSLPLLGPSLF